MSDPTRRHRRYTAAPVREDGWGLPAAVPGTRALVVGASGPLAAPVTAALAAAGWSVALAHGSDAEPARSVVAGLGGSGHVAVAADPADPQAVARLVESLEHAGGIDLVVDVSGAAAGLPPLGVHLEDWTDALTAALTVDLLGPATVAHAAAHAMARSGRPGRIVIVAGPESGSALGAAVSAGRRGLADGLAAELRGTSVAVSTVVAGPAGADQVAAAVLSVLRSSSSTLTLR